MRLWLGAMCLVYSIPALADCDDDPLAQMNLSGEEWKTACTKDKTGRVILAASRPPDKSEPIKVILVVLRPDGATTRVEKIIGGAERGLLSDLAHADEWMIDLVPDPFGRSDRLRVDVGGRYGEDYYVGQIITSFFAIEPTDVELLWSGRGERHQNIFDCCLLHEFVTFRLTKYGKLERKVKGFRSFHNAGFGKKMLDDFRSQCVKPRDKREVFRLR